MDTAATRSSEATRIEVNVAEFARGEIAVKLRRDNTLLVHALHLDQFAVDNFFRKELVKTFPLPAGADIDRIRSVIRSTGILTIDIPMIRDQQAIRRSQEELFKTIDQPKKRNSRRSASQTDLTNSNHQPIRTSPVAVPKRTGSLAHVQYHPYASNSTLADLLQSTFHPTFTPTGKKLILKVDTRGYEADELTVRLLDHDLLVHGQKKAPPANGNKHQMKQFSQSIRLPTGIDIYNVTSQVLEDGVLVIDIPLLNSVLYYR